MVNVAIVEDSADVRSSLVTLFSQHPTINVVGLAEDVEGAKAMIERCHPDIVMLDVELKHNDTSMAVLHHLRTHWPSTKVIMLSNWTWDSLREGFLDAGACAYFDKSTEFLQARDWVAAQAH